MINLDIYKILKENNFDLDYFYELDIELDLNEFKSIPFVTFIYPELFEMGIFCYLGDELFEINYSFEEIEDEILNFENFRIIPHNSSETNPNYFITLNSLINNFCKSLKENKKYRLRLLYDTDLSLIFNDYMKRRTV